MLAQCQIRVKAPFSSNKNWKLAGLYHPNLILWLPSLLILSKNCTWMELLTTRLSPAWHSWSFQKCTSICLTWSWALHCHAVNASRVPSQRSQRFASILPTA